MGKHCSSYVPKPGCNVIPSRPPPAECTVENCPFCLVPRHAEDPLVDISGGSFSINASQLLELEALSRKTAAAISSVLSIEEYVHNQPEISDESKAGLHHLKLDLVSAFNFSLRTVHSDMLMSRSITLGKSIKNYPFDR